MSHNVEFGKSHKGNNTDFEACPQIMNDLAKFLKDRDHSCVAICGMKNHTFE